MQETIEDTKTTDQEIKASERDEHVQEPRPFRMNKRVMFIAAALLTLCLAAVIYLARDKRHAVAPQGETTSASGAITPGQPGWSDVAVTSDEQMRQITVEPVAERALD